MMCFRAKENTHDKARGDIAQSVAYDVYESSGLWYRTGPHIVLA